jgi:hypothetical protein
MFRVRGGDEVSVGGDLVTAAARRDERCVLERGKAIVQVFAYLRSRRRFRRELGVWVAPVRSLVGSPVWSSS